MFGSEISESRSENSELCSDASARGRRTMSSVALAQKHSRELGKLLAPDQGWKAQVSAIHRALTREQFEWKLEKLTWNRVKSWLFAEARRVDYEEVRALEELRAEQEARRAKLKLAATANMLAAHLAAEGTPLDSDQIRALGRISGGMDLSGVVGGAQ